MNGKGKQSAGDSRTAYSEPERTGGPTNTTRNPEYRLDGKNYIPNWRTAQAFEHKIVAQDGYVGRPWLDDLNSVDWASISDILRQENYSKLEEVVMLRVNSHLLDEAMDIIMDRMKGLLEKNPSVDLVLSNSRQPVMVPLFGW
ncbi:hypothetical protein ARMGADRAFT_1099688 [Armillaria gallica]|uniref:Uncharacterized protein n=1 Tax=Armillaria gallica TaxID=47427 RepID=A0A2H3CA93_ARMGA|nr:hypothetical protein ARMGADRAFT_1099688 [Armillaria gallica]